MFENIEEFVQKRYTPLELELLNATKKTLRDNFDSVKDFCLSEWQKAISTATEIQSVEKIPCTYMSISFCSNSMFGGTPNFQIDFFDYCGLYGVSLARGRMSAEFLFTHWQDFKMAALDDSYYLQNKIFRVKITNLFWTTIDKLVWLFADFAKYFAPEIKSTDSFARLSKTEKFYIACGPYPDLKNIICAVLPELNLEKIAPEEVLTFRESHDKIYRQQKFSDLNLSECKFEKCCFEECTFKNVDLTDVCFLNCEFNGSKFISVNLTGTNFSECKLTNCEFQKSAAKAEVAAERYFLPLKFDNCKISESIVEGCDFNIPE